MVVGNPSNPTMIGQAEYAVEIDRLDFAYPQSLPTDEARMVLNGFSMQLKPGSRCLLLGANGSGKSTLLKLLAGKHLVSGDNVKVMGTDPFRDLKLNLTRAFLDTQWGMRTVAFAGYGCPLQADIRVGGMMRKLQDAHPERRDELVKILGVDPEWRMHRVSDGQRRRVQLLLGLVRPFDILLLDELAEFGPATEGEDGDAANDMKNPNTLHAFIFRFSSRQLKTTMRFCSWAQRLKAARCASHFFVAMALSSLRASYSACLLQAAPLLRSAQGAVLHYESGALLLDARPGAPRTLHRAEAAGVAFQLRHARAVERGHAAAAAAEAPEVDDEAARRRRASRRDRARPAVRAHGPVAHGVGRRAAAGGVAVTARARGAAALRREDGRGAALTRAAAGGPSRSTAWALGVHGASRAGHGLRGLGAADAVAGADRALGPVRERWAVVRGDAAVFLTCRLKRQRRPLLRTRTARFRVAAMDALRFHDVALAKAAATANAAGWALAELRDDPPDDAASHAAARQLADAGGLRRPRGAVRRVFGDDGAPHFVF
ncbi:ATPase [Aureococcus anophagefferens]|nr:ATPase [Aureococcus anophagefferens]